MKITTRMTLINTLYMSLFLVIFCFITIYFFQKSLISEFDKSLVERHAYLQRHLEVNAEGEVYFRGSDQPNYVRIKGIEDQAYVEVLSEARKVLFKNFNFFASSSFEDHIEFFKDKNGHEFRMITRSIKKFGKVFIIKAAFKSKRISMKIKNLIYLFLIITPLGIIVIGLINYFLSKRSLAPIRSIISESKNISTDHLNKRLKVLNKNDETGELTEVLNNLLERIDKSFRSLKQFTSDASHELRTPISAIKLMCEVNLQKNQSIESYKDTLIAVIEENNRMMELIESLLLLARGDAGVLKPQKTRFKISDKVEEVVNLLSVLAEEKKQSLTTNLDTHLYVVADSSLIRQAIIGLVHNAITYSPKNSLIHIETFQQNENVCLSVSDQGPGIPKEHQGLIFDRFFRVKSDRARLSGGTGLGLSIVKWISEIHDGNILYLNNNPKGSRFNFEIPGGSV